MTRKTKIWSSFVEEHRRIYTPSVGSYLFRGIGAFVVVAVLFPPARLLGVAIVGIAMVATAMPLTLLQSTHTLPASLTSTACPSLKRRCRHLLISVSNTQDLAWPGQRIWTIGAWFPQARSAVRTGTPRRWPRARQSRSPRLSVG